MQKSRSRLGETLIFKVSRLIFAKFWTPKMDAKSDMEKRCKKKCAKKSFGLEIWCSWLRFRRPGARPWRPKSVPRAAQDGPKIWEQLCQAPFVTLLGPLGHFFAFFAILFEFWMMFRRFLFEFWSILRRFLTESASNQSSQSKPKQAKASRSKPKEAKASKSQLELKFKISSTLDRVACLRWLWPDFACFC